MKYLSLFSGVGGLELGIKRAYENKRLVNQGRQVDPFSGRQEEVNGTGVDNTHASQRGDSTEYGSQATCIGFSEVDKYASKVYQHHFPNHKAYGDITTINEKDLPDFELLVGGFPCQSFSIAGKRGGFDDTRGTLFFEIARIVKEKQPRLLLLENVKGLLSHDKGKTFATIISTLDELGYDCQWQVLNSKDFGVPQNRERVFIIGHLRGTPRPEVFPITETDGQIKRELASTTVDANYWKGIDNHGARTAIIQLNSPERARDRVYGKGGVGPSLNTMQGGGRQPFIEEEARIRRLTPLECERLQGFPDNWTNVGDMSDTQRYKQMGNAVTVNVIASIVNKII